MTTNMHAKRRYAVNPNRPRDHRHRNEQSRGEKPSAPGTCEVQTKDIPVPPQGWVPVFFIPAELERYVVPGNGCRAECHIPT